MGSIEARIGEAKAQRIGISAAALGFLLGGAFLLTRLPFQTRILTNFDAGNYVLALQHFDVRLSQPQAPGYLLYVLLGHLFKLLIPDPLVAFVWVSMVFSGLGVAAIFLAGERMFGRRAGVIAAILLGTSTVFWFYSEVVAPYTLDFFMSALTGWLCYCALTDTDRRLPWLSALALGLAGGVRPQTLAFLAPLFLYALWGKPAKTALGSLALAAAVFLVFFIPAVMLSGGPVSYLRAMKGILPIFRDASTLVRATRLDRFVANAANIARYTLRGLGELVLPLALVGALNLAGSLRPLRGSRLVFLLLWFLPTWIVYLLVWPGNIGTILVSLPPLFLLAAWGFDWLMRLTERGFAAGAAVLALVAFWNILVFTVLPVSPFGASYRTFDNAANLRQLEAKYRSKLALIQELPSQGTLVFSDDFRHMQYYLPQYHTLSLPHFNAEAPARSALVVSIEGGGVKNLRNVTVDDLIPAGMERLVWFYPDTVPAMAAPLVAEQESRDGYSIMVLDLPPGKQLRWDDSGLALAGGR